MALEIAVSPTLRPKLAPELGVPGYSGVVVRPCVCLVCVSFVGVCVLIVVVTCSMMVFPFISSAFPFGMGCIWVCRWPLWESVWPSLGPFLGPVYVARAAFSCNELVPPGGTTTLHVARAVPPGGTTTLHKSGSTGTGNKSKLRA